MNAINYPNETLTGIHVKLKDENGFEVQNGYEVISPLYHDEDDKRDVMWEQYVWGFYCDSDHDGEYDDRLDNHFSTRWVGVFDFGYTKYKYNVKVDDGVRMWVDGNKILDSWQSQGEQTVNTDHDFTKAMYGGNHTVTVEFFQDVHNKKINLSWWNVGDDSYMKRQSALLLNGSSDYVASYVQSFPK